MKQDVGMSHHLRECFKHKDVGMGLYDSLSWFRHCFSLILDVTSLHHPSFHRNDILQVEKSFIQNEKGI